MKTKILILGILVAFVTNTLFSQSLESQLKIIFGDMLQDSKYKEARIIGKALSTSGNMNYNMEMIQAQNKKEITINLPQNTYMGQNNQLMPNAGYKWANPSNPADYNVLPLSSNSYSTLPPYNLDYLKKCWKMGDKSTLKFLFTYNWFSDINGDQIWDLSEFNNIKRTFYLGERIEFVFGFSSINYDYYKLNVKKYIETLNFTMQLFNAANGESIVNSRFYSTFESNVFKLHRENLGNSLPAGKYLIAVSMNSQGKLKPRAITVLREYFEVIE